MYVCMYVYIYIYIYTYVEVILKAMEYVDIGKGQITTPDFHNPSETTCCKRF